MPVSALAPQRKLVEGARSVQSYIDEKPCWPNGARLGSAPMTRMQWLIWVLAASGKFFEGLVVFMTGVAMPLIAEEFGLGKTGHGVIGAATLFGVLIGAIGLGGLSDHFGRKRMFVIEMFIFVVFLALLVGSPNYPALVVFLFGLGVALGCDYPTAHVMISENIPSAMRGRLVLAAFGFQALGALCGVVVGYAVLKNLPDVGAWRLMYATALIPALAVAVARLSITESAHWLLLKGRPEEARREILRLLARDPAYPERVALAEADEARRTRARFAELFAPANRRAAILAAVPWFLQDLSTYGVGIFTPTILAAAVGHKSQHVRSLAELIDNDMLAAKGAGLIDLLLVFGMIAAIALVNRYGSIRLQIVGFLGCALGLGVAALSTAFEGSTEIALIFAGFMIFNFMTNMGPNAQTYLIAGEVFPTRLRGMGAGFAAAFAKIGAVSTAFLFPILLADLGTKTLLIGLICCSALGAWISWRFRIHTTGVNLEELG